MKPETKEEKPRCGWIADPWIIRNRAKIRATITNAKAFMQDAGMVNDHVVGCFRYRKVSG